MDPARVAGRHAENGRPASYILERCNYLVEGFRMIRLIIIFPLVVVAWLLVVKLVSDLKKASIDWTGVTTIIGFIALAFWLRHITGMGG